MNARSLAERVQGAATNYPVGLSPANGGLENGALRIWAELCAGAWEPVIARDVGARRIVLIGRIPTPKPIDWFCLSHTEREVLDLLAQTDAQKVVAIKLGLSPSRVSGAVGSAVRRLGLTSTGRMLRAYCAWRAALASTEVRSPRGE